jgi:tetratricopeptide (TPR) repeat protein
MKIIQSITLTAVLLASGSQVSLANYAAATQAFKTGNYVGAVPEFYNSYTSPQNKAERVRAEWFLAQSLQRLGLYYSASRFYSVIVRRGNNAGNPYFKAAMDELGKINAKVSLGQSHVVQLFKAKISSSDVPGAARGFYFYYKGVEFFGDQALEKAKDAFEKVPSDSSYYNGAIFHLGVIENLSGNQSQALAQFEKVLRSTRDAESEREIREMAIMNIARINYEQKRYPESINYYGQIPRDSDHWLDAIWETSWAFFFMQKFNNTLGQIHTLHSPFFENRFYPEAFILQAITYLRLCRYDEVKASMKNFKVRYAPVNSALKSLLGTYSGNPRGFFKHVYDYSRGENTKFREAEEIIKKLTYMDAFRSARDIMRFSDREIEALDPYQIKWSSSGLHAVLKDFLKAKKSQAVADAGERMYKLSTTYTRQLYDLSNQTRMIVAEMQLGKLEKLRSQISAVKEHTKIEFIGGMQKLAIGQSLEYWPFEKEYWEDELGYYVYNLASKCTKK